MPYIKIRTNKKVDDSTCELIKSKLGEDISVLGKSESWLMVDVSDEAKNLYFRGNKDDIAYVEVKLFGRADVERWVRSGNLEPVRISPGKKRYRLIDLQKVASIQQNYLLGK